MTIFNYIDVVLHKKKTDDFTCEMGDQFSGFMLNRWISMYSPMHAQVINETTNKYIGSIGTRDEQYQFMHAIIPQGKKKHFNYIKKIKEPKAKEDDIDVAVLLAKKHEISVREARELLKL